VGIAGEFIERVPVLSLPPERQSRRLAAVEECRHRCQA
jgi:hypothetical protein